MTRIAFVIVLALGLALPASASAAQVRDCGNYGFPEGHDGERPIFTQEEIVGAGVYDIRSKVTRCRNRRIGDEVWIMRCTASGGRVVRFEYGA